MLSTKNLPESNGVSKTINPGNRLAKINNITLEDGYKAGSYHVVLHVEGVDMGENFEGFLVDSTDPQGPRYKGQVGRVKMSSWAFEDGEINGRPIYRDISILTALKNLAIALGKQNELDEIKADTIEEYVPKAARILADGETFLNWCFSGREYEKNGYTKYDLFLERASKEGVPFENADVDPDKSRLYKYDPAKHIRKKKPAEGVQNFTPQAAGVGAGQADFEMD